MSPASAPGGDPPTPDGSPDPQSTLEAAARRFGVTSLAPYQMLVCTNVVEGRRQLVILPTGSGKTFCFAVPATLLNGPTLVVVPLLSLMTDLERRLQGTVPVNVLRGAQKDVDRRNALHALATSTPGIVLATPEILLSSTLARRLEPARIAHLVVDEAHCISEWGETFRPAYRRLGEIVRRFRPENVSAFTATASQRTVGVIRDALFGGAEVVTVRGDPDRPNLFYRVVPTLSRHRLLWELIMGARKPLLAFAPTRAAAEVLAREAMLTAGERPRAGVDPTSIRFYHAGLEADERQRIERWYLESTDGVLVATSAFGMGVDKTDIRTVLHLDPPETVEAYLQETGRAGRDREPATVVLGLRPVGPEAEDGSWWSDYARRPDVCRRERLLRDFSTVPIPCGGCDVCANDVRAQPEGATAFDHAVAIADRRWRRGQLEAFLAGRPHRLLRSLGRQ